ncbi:MAG: ChbG/HpnK family deacetylase [Myxococcales bacterium]|nr:ChbG/HpnK family deacetylase [Myxococcales bacterium]
MGTTPQYPPLNELLGYPKDSRLLILNADDAGVCHAINEGIVEIFKAGLVKSSSVMIPAPWLMEFVHLKKENPAIKCGVHLTTTSEWRGLRWGPVASRDKVPSLLDSEGYFYASEHDFFAKAAPEEVELEFRAQIERAIALGLQPTHIDSHMGAYHWDERFFQIAYELAKEFGLAMRIAYAPRRDRLRQEGKACVDRLIWDSYEVPIGDRSLYYRENLKRLEPGVTEIIIHPSKDTEELRAICQNTAINRVFDLEFFSCQEIQTFLAREGIVCIGYDALQALQRGKAAG